MNTVLGWILDFAVRHECVELVQGHSFVSAPTAVARSLAVGSAAQNRSSAWHHRSSGAETTENKLRGVVVKSFTLFRGVAGSLRPAEAFNDHHPQVSSFEEAMKTHSGCAPESAPKWLLELKERVVICLHAENKLRAARETLDAFFPERPVLLNSILHDKRGPVGSMQFNQAYISRKVSARSLKQLAQELSDFMNEWLQRLPPCLLDQLVDCTGQEDFLQLTDSETQEPTTGSLDEHTKVVPPPAVQKLDKQKEADDELTEEEEDTVSRGKPTKIASRKRTVQPQKQPMKVSRKSSRRRDPVPDKPGSDEPSEDEEADQVPEIINLRSKSASLLTKGGKDPLVQARRGSPMPERIKPVLRHSRVKTSIVLEKCVTQPEWGSDEEEEEEKDEELQASALPKLGAAPALVKFKPLKPLSEISNQRKGRKRVKWTLTEEDQLRKGVDKCGEGNWAEVLEQYKFNDIRTSVDLKDKWRNLNK